MNPPSFTIIAAAIVALVMMVLMILVLGRYTQVGPNQVLIVSGRKVRLPDGRCIGFRIVKGGGTFVSPVQNPAACAAKVQTAADLDLGKMGLSLISFTVRNVGLA
jgi:uncharacterized membrane protein YqiK